MGAGVLELVSGPALSRHVREDVLALEELGPVLSSQLTLPRRG